MVVERVTRQRIYRARHQFRYKGFCSRNIEYYMAFANKINIFNNLKKRLGHY